jgi:hypothetical protein
MIVEYKACCTPRPWFGSPDDTGECFLNHLSPFAPSILRLGMQQCACRAVLNHTRPPPPPPPVHYSMVRHKTFTQKFWGVDQELANVQNKCCRTQKVLVITMKSKGNNNKPVLKVVTTKTLQPPKRYHSADVCLPAITWPCHNSFGPCKLFVYL